MSPCCDKRHTNRGAWSKEEDQKLINYIRAHGEGCWRSLPKAAGLLRCGKSCRLRWINYLRPDVKRGNFEEDEADLIVKLHALLGNRWSLIAGRLPGRTDNEVKNYWNSHLRKKLAGKGIDPNNHRVTPPPPPLYPSHSSNSASATPSSSNGVCWRSNSIKVDDNRESDCAGGSCSGGGQLPDLNLDLTICAMASSSSGDLLSAEPILALDQNTDN